MFVLFKARKSRSLQRCVACNLEVNPEALTSDEVVSGKASPCNRSQYALVVQ